MRIVLLLFSIVTSNCAWKENFYVQQGRYTYAYQYQVFIIAENFPNSKAWLHCKNMQKDHNYFYPDNKRLYLTAYQVSGYVKEDDNVDFSIFKDSFERYCYLPCDGLTLFYNQHPLLKQTLSHVPFLNVLIPYWIKGDVVRMVAVDIIKANLAKDKGKTIDRLPDISINIVVDRNDSYVTEQDAVILGFQLIENEGFSDVNLVYLSNDEKTENITINIKYNSDWLKEKFPSIQSVQKSYEKRQWWLKNLWASKLGLILLLLPIFRCFSSRFQSRFFWAFVSLIIKEIVQR